MMPTAIDHADFLAEPAYDVRLHDFAKEAWQGDRSTLATLQDVFYADRRYAQLIGLRRRQPSAQESHDYLWRCGKVLPERGRIAIFKRSYYEELAVVRVHEALLRAERLPPQPRAADIWVDRYADIVSFEQHLVSRDEQRKRQLARIDEPAKHWKISAGDIHERTWWEQYRHACEKLLTHTGHTLAPCSIVPADRKWFTRAAVANVVVERRKALGLGYPSVTSEQRAALAAERERLTHECENAPNSPALVPS